MSQWRRFDLVFGILIALAFAAARESFVINHNPTTNGCGGDFLQFYVAGTIVRRGEAERLYDQPYFCHFQESLREEPLPSLYPPSVGLLMAPIARLSYDRALGVWWAIEAACILATGAIFYRTVPLPRTERMIMLAALAAMLPLWIAVGIGQPSPILLLPLAGGLMLHQGGKRGWAGLLLSILCIKPQLAAGLVLWMLLRRDRRTLLGLAAGLGLQVAFVALFLGPAIWLTYLHAMPEISGFTRAHRLGPLAQASLTGMASNLFWSAGLTTWELTAMRITYAVTAGAAAVTLFRVIQARRSRQPLLPTSGVENCEYACGALFMMLFPPYFLVYDQALLAVPLVMLWSSPAWRGGVALFATTTVLIANLSFTLGFSLTGPLALIAMFQCASHACRLESPATRKDWAFQPLGA